VTFELGIYNVSLPVSKAATVLWAIATVWILVLSLITQGIPPNEYQAIGIDGAIDCDGPLSVLIFGAPSLVSCSVAVLLFPRRVWLKGVFGYVLPFALLVSWTVSTMSIAQAIREQQSVGHQEVCGAGL
jgi:hypothetical protein